MKASLSSLIKPKSIAVFGGKEARRVVEQCSRMGFSGEIWPVHPKLDEIAGRRCFRSVAELPGAPDASFVGVNRQLTVDFVRELVQAGGGGAVCYASGFREASVELSDSADLQDMLVATAGDMPILGPNCYGLINALDGSLLWPDQHGLVTVERGVAILTQSSNIAINISMQSRGLPIAYLITAGNQAQTGLSDLAAAAIEDPRVTAIGLHIEGIGDLVALERLALRAREFTKPVVALKVGRSAHTRQANVSHTASLAGDDAVSDAVFERLGIGRVPTLPALLETLKLLHLHPPLDSFCVSSMSCSGSEASLIADAGVGRKVVFSPVNDEQRTALPATLGEMVAITNPPDYHTFVWGSLEKQTAAFSAMMRGNFALNLVVLDFPRRDRCDTADWTTTRDAVIAASKATGAVDGIVASLGENMPEEDAVTMMANGIVPFCGIEEALVAAEISAKVGASWAGSVPASLIAAQRSSGEAVTVNNAEAKADLASFGLNLPKGRVAATPAEATEAAERIGFPVVLKGLGIAHKTQAGAVKLNLTDRAAVLAAAGSMPSEVSGYLVEAMLAKPVAELIVGVFPDPIAGLVLTVGAGGIFAELIEDSAILTLPSDPGLIGEAIGGLRIAKLLTGYRGGPKGDVPALISAIVSVAAYVEAHAGTLDELDINPLMVMPEGQGVFAADALIRRRL